MTIETPDGEAIIVCPHCRGNGWTGGHLCPVCMGDKRTTLSNYQTWRQERADLLREFRGET